MKCLICEKLCVDLEFLRRHVAKSHRVTTKEYVLRFELKGISPVCNCGCGKIVTWHQSTKRFNEYVHGHHAQFRRKTDSEKAKIGQANSVNMKRYMKEHPDVVKQKISQLMSGRTNETYEKVSRSVRAFWSSDSPLTHQRRREASDRAIVLLEQNKIGPRAPFKCCWHDNPFTGKEEYMHSSWETSFLMRCINDGYPVTKQHGIVIDYQQSDGTWHRYLPDFKAIEENVLFEVKGVMTENDELKLRAAEALGYEVVIVRDSYDDEDKHSSTQTYDS